MKDAFKLEQVAVRLTKTMPLYSKESITKPSDVIKILAKELKDYDREVVCVTNLNTKGQPINFSIVSMGTINASLVHPRELIKNVFLSNSTGIILLHNHPSGNLNPSKEDIQLTNRLGELCKLINIPLIDHIIIGAGNKDSVYSFKADMCIDIDEHNLNVKESISYIENDSLNKFNGQIKESFMRNEMSSIEQVMGNITEKINENKSFDIEITEVLQKTISVEAKNLSEAMENVKEMYDNQEIVLTSEDYISTNIDPTKDTLDKVMEIETRPEHAKQSEKNKLYISLPKGLCRQMDSSRKEGEKYNCMIMPNGVKIQGKDIGGSIINPLYMNENVNNPKEYTAVYYLDGLKNNQVRLTHKDGNYEKVNIKELKAAIDEHQEEYTNELKEDKMTNENKMSFRKFLMEHENNSVEVLSQGGIMKFFPEDIKNILSGSETEVTAHIGNSSSHFNRKVDSDILNAEAKPHNYDKQTDTYYLIIDEHQPVEIEVEKDVEEEI